MALKPNNIELFSGPFNGGSLMLNNFFSKYFLCGTLDTIGFY